MAENERRMVNINTANVEALSQLPGIGPEMAQRIIDARPYQRAEDLTRVQGIGQTVLARLQPHLAFNGSDEQEDVDAVEAPAVIEAKAPEAGEESEMPPIPEGAASEPVVAEEEAEEVSLAPASTLEEAKELETPLEPTLQPPEAPEAEQPPADVQTAPEADEEEAEAVQGAEETPEANADERVEARPAQAASEPQPARRGWVLWMVAGSAVLVLLLSLGLNLGILASINSGRLQFASPAEVGAMRVRVDGLDARAAELGQEVQGLRTRLDNVEAFGGRIDTLEGSTEQLGAELQDTADKVQSLSTEISDLGQELDSVSQDVNALDEQVSTVQGDVEALQEQTVRTQSFFDGLRSLLDELFTPEGGAQ